MTTETLKRKDGKVDRRSRKATDISLKKATILRAKLDYAVNHLGVRISYISHETGIWDGSIRQFIAGEKRLFRNDERIEKLDILLNNYNFKHLKFTSVA